MTDLVISKYNLERVLDAISGYYTLSDSRKRITAIYYAPKHNRIYFVTGGTYLFYTDDDFATVNPVTEVNTYYDATIISTTYQAITGIVESIDGTLILIGKDWRKETPASATDWNSTESGTVWRKGIDDATFTRTVARVTVWSMPENCVMSAGYYSASYQKMVAFSNYTTTLYYSIDDGETWLECDMTSYADDHVHSVYLPQRVYKTHAAKMWVTVGDDFTGAKGGAFYADTLDGSNNLTGWTQAFAERPGYRLVGLTGTARKMFFGNESGAGGVLAISNDATSIAAGDFEYCFGRNRLDFNQFNTLIATDDGILFTATDCYPALDTPHKGMGGYVYISNNEGASFIEIPLFETFNVAQATYDGSNFWLAGTTQTNEPNLFGMTVYKIPKPSPFEVLKTPYIVKSPIVDIAQATHAQLAAEDYTPIVDLGPYKNIVLSIETFGAGTLQLQATPFLTDPAWTEQGDIPGWYNVMTINFSAADRKDIVLPQKFTHNRLFRVYNPSATTAVEIKHLMFIGKD